LTQGTPSFLKQKDLLWLKSSSLKHHNVFHAPVKFSKDMLVILGQSKMLKVL